MEKPTTRTSYSSRPLSTATTDARPTSMAPSEEEPPLPISTNTTVAPALTVLKDDELARVRRALGATRPRPYSNAPAASRIWPARNLPDGLYRDVVSSRCRAQYFFYFVSTMYNICIIVQLMLGATLTAIAGVGSSGTADRHGITITVLAAANTVNAGIVALLHNSGLPDRVRNDRNTYAAVELSLVELLNSGVIQAPLPDKGDVVANAVAWAYTLYTNANLTVQNNKPTSYVGSQGNAQNTLAY